MKKKDPNWYDHLEFGDSFHTGNPSNCGICGCQSDYFGIGKWYLVKKLYLICPGRQVNPALHDLIRVKKDLCIRGELPASVLQELKQEIIQMSKQLQTEAASSAKTSNKEKVVL